VIPLLGVLFLAGPLQLPMNWNHHEDVCLHAVCGSYADPHTGTVVSYYISDERLPWQDPCPTPSQAVAFRGTIGAVQLCGFEALDAQQVQEEELAQTAPDWVCQVGEEGGIAAPPVEASLIVATFVSGNTYLRLVSETCDPLQLATVYDMIANVTDSAVEDLKR